MHVIENKNIRIAVKEQGAELVSLFDKTNQIEHMWAADPAVWPWHVPILFPVIGRCLNDQIKVGQKTYPMEKHGFARRSEFDLINEEKDMLHFRLRASEKTSSIYPYHFDFHVFYHIENNYLIQTFEVENTGIETMYFQLGAHPGFAVPFLPGEVYEDYFIEFDNDTILDRENINTDGFFDTSISNVIKGTNRLPLEKDMFANDAIILKDLNSRKVTLRSHKNPHSVSVEFPAFNYLGLWAKVGAQYVCIEPWLGCADTAGKPVELKDKEGIISLPQGETFTVSFTVEIG